MVAALALGLVACGDEKQDDQTKDELVQAANRICHKFDRRLETIEEPRNARNTEQAATYFDQAAPAIEAAYLEFKALDPNDETERDWNAFLARARELRQVTRRVADKAVKGDRSYINDLREVESVSDDSEQIARRLGATTCAS
jgi:hypothetical protein